MLSCAILCTQLHYLCWVRCGVVQLPKISDERSALEVKRLAHPGGKRNILVGVPGLHMQLTPKRGRSWVLRVKVAEVRRDIGLGGFPAVTLSQAREKARKPAKKSTGELIRWRNARPLEPSLLPHSAAA